MSEMIQYQPLAKESIEAMVPGSTQFVNALRISNPEFSELDAAQVANALWAQTSPYVAEGARLALVQQITEDEAQIIVLGLKVEEPKSF